ncbi:hypothetical protein HAX54_013519 [Datura stramonium]|uniref:Uncharacterized protein n=1 Tax=Datura stramonium TaxID=4076 RepID=A0ABS8TLE6_DATST|nr:hypothetical protein [Datura stramonium]
MIFPVAGGFPAVGDGVALWFAGDFQSAVKGETERRSAEGGAAVGFPATVRNRGRNQLLAVELAWCATLGIGRDGLCVMPFGAKVGLHVTSLGALVWLVLRGSLARNVLVQCQVLSPVNPILSFLHF